MKLKTKNLFLLAVASGISFNLNAAPVLVPNGDFETAGGADWGEAGGPATTFSYPSSGGNAGGYGVMTNDGTGFGVFIANGDATIPVGDLGLEAGKAYNFFQDMRLDSGSSIGTLKVEFYDAAGAQISNTGDIPNTLIGDGSTWETYVFPVSVPENTVSIKVVPIWGAGSAVGFDNIGVDNTPIIIPPGPRFPNGDFEIADGESWFFDGADGTSVTYPSTDGNPDGFAQIDASAGGSAVLSTNNNGALSLASVGLTAGETYTFSVDMKIISGTNLGGLRAEYIPTGSGVQTPNLIGDGSTWETYTFELTLPSGSGGIIVYLHGGADSIVAFDNLDVIVPEPEPFYAGIRPGTTINWLLVGDGLIYQPQGSFDQEEWDNIGPAIEDDTITSAFVETSYPFYRVEVFQNVLANAALNGDFEENFSDPNCADSWACLSSSNQPPTWTTDDAFSGDACMRIAVQNDNTPNANQAEIQQNVSDSGGFITVGETYELSFWAKQISEGVSYVQNYRVQWLDGVGAIIGGTQFTSFRGGTGTWEKISVGGLVPPDGTFTALIQIFGATGAVDSVEARGEVLIDDLNLATTGTALFDDIFATVGEGVEISWPTEEDASYQIESSTDLKTFIPFGSPRAGDGTMGSAVDSISVERKYYRVIRN